MLWWTLAACTFSAATTVIFDTGGDTGQAETGADDTADSADTAGGDSDSAATDPSDVDDDQDGVTENDGDCDDGDDDVHPGAEDDCDGVDDDCDGTTDEDAADGDAYEPNDESAYDLGSLEDPALRTLTATLRNDDDVDRFQFTVVDDTFDFFTVTITLSNIPADATYQLTLDRLRSDGDLATGRMDQVFGTGELTLSFSDVSLQEDGGDYEVVVEAIAGADCARTYLLDIAQ